MNEYVEIATFGILSGFGVYSIVFLIGRPVLSESKKSIIDNFDHSACLVAAFIGAIYLISVVVNLIFQFSMVKTHFEDFTISEILFGKYWFYFWIQPAFYSSSQLLWFKKIRKKKYVRFITALLMITSVESLIIFFTSFNQDYLPSSWSITSSVRIKYWLISIGLFGVTTALFHFIKTKIKVYTSK